MSDQAEIASIEKFELMSAYLDGEVTASERQQVEKWLQNDAIFKAQYQRMQGMHQAVSHLPVAEPVVPVMVLADQVFAKISERRQSRWLKIGGAAVAATLVAVGTGLSGIWGGSSNAVPQLAKLSLPTAVLAKLEIIPNPAPMMVALNNSIVNIPQSPQRAVGGIEDADLGLFDALDTGDDI
jgi:anti-sigma factor RsiW